MKNHMDVKNISITLCSVLVAMLACSCGKSDATAGNKNLVLVPLHAANNDKQLIYDKVMNISLVTETGAPEIPVFLEGEANEVKLDLNILDPGITEADLNFDQGTQPDGSTLIKSLEQANRYVFRWTPPTGYVGAPNNRINKVKFIAHVLKASESIPPFVSRYTLTISVEHTQVRPKIVGVELPEIINEGVDQLVKIKVQDAAHLSVNEPDLNITSYKGARNDENHRFDWASKLVPNQPLVSGPDKDGVYTFNYTLVLKDQVLPVPPTEGNVAKPDSNASIVNLCFSSVATSKISKLQSDNDDRCTRVQFAVQPPVAYFDGDPDGVIGTSTAVAGKEFTLNFEVKTSNGKGNISSPQSSFSHFASDPKGQPKIEEVANPKDPKAVLTPGQASADRFFKLSWIPSCKASGSYTYALRFSNELNGQKKLASPFSRKIIIGSKSDTCDAPAVAKPAKQ